MFILSCISFVYAQEKTDNYRPFIEEGTTWTVSYWRYFDTEAFRTDVYSIKGDTIIGSLTCSKLLTGDQFVGALYEEGRKVWLIKPGETAMTLLYDFGAKVGDELLLNGKTAAKVTDVRTIDYHGRQMRCISFEDESSTWDGQNDDISQSVWIEGVGSCIAPLDNCLLNNRTGVGMWVTSCQSRAGIIYENADSPCSRLADMLTQADYRELVEEGKQWTVGIWGAGHFDRRLDFCLVGDTLVGGQTYKKLICMTHERGGQGKDVHLCGLLREDSRKVWGVVPGTASERLLYDFSQYSGDTVVIETMDDTYSLQPMLKATYLYYGHSEYGLKIYGIQSPEIHDVGQEWVVGIGNIGSPLRNFCTRTGMAEEILVSCRVGETVLYHDAFETSRLEQDIDISDGMPGIAAPQGTLGNIHSLFDLTGRRLASPPTKGVYIENGKKMAVK